MADPLTFVSAIVGFILVLAAGVNLGAGGHTALTGLFAAQGARDWPTGVQEPDAPHFSFAHPTAGAPGVSIAGDGAIDVPSTAPIEDLYAGPLR
jgi:hypothetical protein